MATKTFNALFFTVLILTSTLANAEVDSGTGSPQEALSILEWMLSWLPI